MDFGKGEVLEGGFGAVAEEDFDFENVVAGGAVDEGVGAAGIITCHAADHAAAGGGGLGSEHETVGFEVLGEFVANDTGLEAYPFFIDVELDNVCPVLRYIDHDSLSDDLSGKGGSGGTRDKGDILLVGERNEFSSVGDIVGNADGDGKLAVDGGVGGIEDARGFVGMEGAG